MLDSTFSRKFAVEMVSKRRKVFPFRSSSEDRLQSWKVVLVIIICSSSTGKGLTIPDIEIGL
jgi:hypothetical protein